MENKLKIYIGDKYADGHGMCETKLFLTNKTNLEIRTAYLESCKKTGLVFESNQDVIVDDTKLHWEHPEYNDRKICVEYQKFKASDLAVNILKEYNIDASKIDSDETEIFIDVLFKFIKISLPDFQYNFIEEDVNTLNLSTGYGLYDDH